MLFLALVCISLSTGCFTPCQRSVQLSVQISEPASAPESDVVLPYKDAFSMIDTLLPTIYMTFDDGPEMGSGVVATIAQNEGIPVSFFMVGLHYKEASPSVLSIYRSIANNPFYQILNHSYTHAYRNRYAKFYNDVEGAIADIEYNQQVLSIKEKVIRLPGSNVWRSPHVFNRWNYKRTSLIVDSLVSRGYKVMGWDAEWRFNYHNLVLKEDSTLMVHKVDSLFTHGLTRLSNHLILLMHDRSFRDAKDSTSLVSFIRMCKRKGYRFGYATNHPYF